MAARDLKRLLPGLGTHFKVASDEIQPGVLVGTLTADVAGRAASHIATDYFDNTTVDRVFADRSIDRINLSVDALAKHSIPMAEIVQPTGIPHDATGGAGIFKIDVTAHVKTLLGQTADSNTKTSVAHFQVALPDNYVAGGLITVRVATELKSVTGTGVTNNGSDLAAVAYKQASGAVGANLVASGSPATYAALDTWYNKDIVITPTGLVAGDVLNVELTLRAIESNAGNGTLQSVIGEVAVLCDVAG